MLGERDGGRYDYECPPGPEDCGEPGCGDPVCEVTRLGAEVASLRSRLLLFADYVCEGCGCAPVATTVKARQVGVCEDCAEVWMWKYSLQRNEDPQPETPAACVSVGMRALAGTRILEGLG